MVIQRPKSVRRFTQWVLAISVAALSAGCGLVVDVTASQQVAASGTPITYAVKVTNQAGCTIGPPITFNLSVAPESVIAPERCGLFDGGIPPDVEQELNIRLPEPQRTALRAQLEQMAANTVGDDIVCGPPATPVPGVEELVLVCTLNKTLAPLETLETRITAPIYGSGPMRALILSTGPAPEDRTGCTVIVAGTGTASGTGCADVTITNAAPALSWLGLAVLVPISWMIGYRRLRRHR